MPCVVCLVDHPPHIQCRAIDLYNAAQAKKAPAETPVTIPKPVTHPVNVTQRGQSVTATVSVTDQELLDRLIEKRDADRKRARDGMRRYRQRLKERKTNDTE